MDPESPSVEVEQPTTDSQPELAAPDGDSSEDNSSDAVSVEKKTGKYERSNQRIRELIREKNALAAQLAQAKGSAPAIPLDGVTPEGIDPEKYAASVEARARAGARDESARMANFTREMDRAIAAHPILKDNEVAQLQVSALINQGYSPMEAAEIYMEDRRSIEEEARSTKADRKEAGDAARKDAVVPAAGKAPKTTAFTEAQIAAMDNETYKKNQAEIKRQWAAGLIK